MVRLPRRRRRPRSLTLPSEPCRELPNPRLAHRLTYSASIPAPEPNPSKIIPYLPNKKKDTRSPRHPREAEGGPEEGVREVGHGGALGLAQRLGRPARLQG